MSPTLLWAWPNTDILSRLIQIQVAGSPDTLLPLCPRPGSSLHTFLILTFSTAHLSYFHWLSSLPRTMNGIDQSQLMTNTSISGVCVFLSLSLFVQLIPGEGTGAQSPDTTRLLKAIFLEL